MVTFHSHVKLPEGRVYTRSNAGKTMPCLPSPRQITIFIGGIVCLPFPVIFVVYDIVFPTL